MRKYHKTQCLELLSSLDEANKHVSDCIARKKTEDATGMLAECQEAAIQLGTIIDGLEGEGTEAVHILEEYCEQVYQVREELVNGKPVNARPTEKAFRKTLARAEGAIRNGLPTRYEAVFLPYKVSMWDSLESIWRAADADPDCDAYVVPIPYYDKEPDGSLGRMHYEGDRYPDYVPVYDYADYNFEERHPEMVYIHNPYDQYNHVTSVHPDYYSPSLKAHTDCLVYVPYYASAGNMSEGQSILLSYFYADYIIVQSESMVGFFDPAVPKEKLLPLGSPKFDKIIHTCENPPAPPEGWAKMMEGKRVFFYNTSIHGFLGDTPRFLKKMAYVFNTFLGREDACLIWRPHPLLETTIDSMRPEVRPVYEDLKRQFVETRAGILDETPEIEDTIAHCDAYIGDSGTSVTALFGVVGKPMYILNNRITEAPGEDDWKAWASQAIRGDRNNRYCITMGNRLFEDRDGDLHYRYLCDLSDEYGGGGYYSRAMEAAGKIVVFPANAEHILVIDRENLSKRRIELRHEIERDGAFAGFFNLLLEDPEVYRLLPNRYPRMVSFDARTEEVSYIEDEAFTDEYSVYTDLNERRVIAARWVFGTKRFKYGDGEPAVIDTPEIEMYVPGIGIKGRRLFCLNREGTRLRAIGLDTGETDERAVPLNGLYTTVLRDIDNLDVIWFLPYEGTVFGKWTLSEDKWETVDVWIDGLVSIRRPEGTVCNEFYFSNAMFTDGKMILAPNWGDKFVEVDTKSHEVREWMPPFEYSLQDKNDYWFNWSVGYFYQDPWTLEYSFYYAPEMKTYALGRGGKTCKEIPVVFDKEEIADLSLGFHRDSRWMPYCCYEDVFNSIDDIASGNIHGQAFEKERQIEAYKAVNESPEGDCGEKVHRVMKERVGV